MRIGLGVLALLVLAACGDEEAAGQGGGITGTGATASSSTGDAEPVSAFESPGPHPVGHATVVLADEEAGRVFPVEIWYPADEGARAAADAGEPIEGFGTTQAERDQLVGLLASAPDPGTNRLAHAARDAAPAPGPWPFVAFSHCFNGVRFAAFTVAERLASHGIAVVAPDHTGGTLYDELAGEAAPLGKEFLEVRLGDMLHVLDRTLDPAAEELPEALRGRFDEARLGVFGHSFGGVTAGRVLMVDARPRAGLALAVPMENPLLPGVTMSDIHVPLLFLLAQEDNSIGEIGNDIILLNFEAANPPVWRLDVKDAGHWSPTDICGIIDGFDAGCTDADVRQTDQQPFSYLDANVARGITASYVTAFFLSTLNGDGEADAYVDGAHPAETVTVSKR